MEIIENKTQRDKEMRNMKDKSHNTDNREGQMCIFPEIQREKKKGAEATNGELMAMNFLSFILLRVYLLFHTFCTE